MRRLIPFVPLLSHLGNIYSVCRVAKLSSLQERLMEYPFYANCMLKPDSVAKRSGSSTSSAAASATGYGTGEGGFSMGVFLTKNYRSHRDILTLPSELFYNGALEQCGAVGVIESMRRFRYAPRQVAATSPDACPLQFQTGDCAIRFVGVNGTHAHEIDSPSFFNSKEVCSITVTLFLYNCAIIPSTCCVLSTHSLGCDRC